MTWFWNFSKKSRK